MHPHSAPPWLTPGTVASGSLWTGWASLGGVKEDVQHSQGLQRVEHNVEHGQPSCASYVASLAESETINNVAMLEYAPFCHAPLPPSPPTLTV